MLVKICNMNNDLKIFTIVNYLNSINDKAIQITAIISFVKVTHFKLSAKQLTKLFVYEEALTYA